MPLPADTYLTVSQLNALFQRITIIALGMESAKTAWDTWQAGGRSGSEPQPNPYYYVRTSWPTAGQPAWGITEDMAFVRVVGRDGNYNKERFVRILPYTEHQGNYETRYTRIIECNWVMYGPNAYDRACQMREQIMYPLIHSIWSSQKLCLVPDISEPRRVPELFDGQWWDRADLSMYFYELVVRNYALNYIESAEITIERDTPPAEVEADVNGWEDPPIHN